MASSSHHPSLSRLDRVFTLLENGASSVTRKAAAKQLGDVQQKHPHELNNLLSKLLLYVCHNEWGTRIGAAEAIEAVVAQVPLWKPDPVNKPSDILSTGGGCEEKLTFAQFDVDKVLNASQTLLGSSGDEYKVPLEMEGMSPKDRVKKQRQMLERQLGLTVGDTSLGVASDDLFQDADLDLIAPEKNTKKSIKKEPKQDCANVICQFNEGMSSRERNLAKRKAKLYMKQQSREVIIQENSNGDGQPSKKRKKNKEIKSEGPTMLEDVPKHVPSPEEWEEWPFNWVSDELMILLFNSSWESRHGACLALREIIKKHGSGCGKRKNMSEQELNESNQSWLTDLSIRLLCVISLDRFADFVSDQVVAPVRESCAQTLSVVASFLEEKHVFEVLNVLLHLHTKEGWEIRQSAMLVLQYIIAVRKDLHSNILPLCFPTIIKGLHDKDGDVRSVSARALMPISTLLSEDPTYEQQMQVLLSILWGSLDQYDEITSSTQSILLLLSKLIKAMPLSKICRSDSPERLLSYLWPFFHHAIPSVREAALSTAVTMLNGETKDWSWLSSVSATGLLNLFQCCLLESKEHIRNIAVEMFTLLVQKSSVSSAFACAYHVPNWLALACQPPLVPIEPRQLLSFEQVVSSNENESGQKERVICGRITNTHCTEEFEEYLMKTRELTSRLIGMLCRHVFCDLTSDDVKNDSPLIMIKQHLLAYMKSQSAVQRIVALHVLSNWWDGLLYLPSFVSADFLSAVQAVQIDMLFYNEVSIKFVQIQSDMKSMLTVLANNRIQPGFPPKPSYSFDDVIDFCTNFFPRVVTPNHKNLFEQRDLLLKLAEGGNKMQNLLDCRVKSTAATVIITAVRSSRNKDPLWKLPDRLNPVIRPLMESIKKEENRAVRSSVSIALTHLVGVCASREPNPNAKLIKNLSLLLCSSTTTCPTDVSVANEFSDETLTSLPRDRVVYDGILTQLRQSEASRTETNKRKRKTQESTENQVPSDVAVDGATKCLQTICSTYGAELFKVLPQLFNIISVLQDSNLPSNLESMSVDQLHSLLQGVLTLKALLPAIVDTGLQQTMLAFLPCVISVLWTRLCHIRYICARCIGTFAHFMSVQSIPIILEQVLCNLDVTKDIVLRRAAVETVATMIETMGMKVVTYVVLLVVPLLGCMSDNDPQVRLLATHCFAQLIQYMPVESSIPDPPDLPSSLVEKKNKERQFLEQLFDPSSLEAYQISVPINAKLRAYQEDGVKWLAFLNRYKLHGVLCDEMGLGKTLQTICIIASDHHCKIKQYQKENPDKMWSPKSLVVCPPTLTGHWMDEVQRFCGDLTPLQYAGTPTERCKLQEQVQYFNLIIASYDVVRNDIEFFNKFKWNYCVLDEGHAIRNGKSKTSQSIKTLSSNHRLILTGTPIQNSVLELWSLFDYLMPGFLGSEQQFNIAFTKPILASRDAKSSSKEQENGVLAMEALHRQVLPFMLRRMKDDVLKDLPPKIIQDYYCDLSALQLELYEDFARSRAKKDAESSIHGIDDEKDQKSKSRGTSHVFQALQYLQKVCNHPVLVLTPTHPHYKSLMHKIKSDHSNIRDIKHASKLTALRQLLLDCGIGVTSDVVSEQSVVNQHRALIFCQHRNMLDIIQSDLLTSAMPTVTYLRLDGAVPANQRFSIVSRFNNDPSIDLLLLTTKVGGLGLNLTGADTVIFVEHDWNPMVDLQAMDRAHRIGQKKVVNVYRLITRGTLEEKVLGLQKFKLDVANTVVGEDNRRLQSMGTSQVLELFTADRASKKKAAMEAATSKGLRAMMENLGELWDQNQYDDEYNLDNFMQTLADE